MEIPSETVTLSAASAEPGDWGGREGIFLMRAMKPFCWGILVAELCVGPCCAQSPLTWAEVRDKFEAHNPVIKAAQLTVDESRAEEITANLRPNPEFTISADGLQLLPGQVWRPLSGFLQTPSISYIHERRQKRELRLENARKSTEIADSNYLDQRRTLLFNLRNTFVQILQAKASVGNAKENLAYWDQTLEVSRSRFQAGDIAQVDFARLQLQRLQFLSDLETTQVNLRTAKIQLLALLNDRAPVEEFDIVGPYDFRDSLPSLDELRKIALEARPDFKAAAQQVELAVSTHKLAIANGSTDPTFGVWTSHNSSFGTPYFEQTLGFSMSIPLRIFDRNQGEKARTKVDISRSQRLREGAEARVFSDVDAAYATLNATINLLQPYRDQYLKLAQDSRDTIAFSYRAGGASLLDYLDAQKAFRDTRLAYLNLVGAYLTAAAQLNLAVGEEVIQ
jgi:outer membrane protein, heavy metal efflux system